MPVGRLVRGRMEHYRGDWNVFQQVERRLVEDPSLLEAVWERCTSSLPSLSPYLVHTFVG